MAEFEVQIKEENLVFRKSPVLTDKVMHYCPVPLVGFPYVYGAFNAVCLYIKRVRLLCEVLRWF